jgi:uncharacterized spore protein YtfJ
VKSPIVGGVRLRRRRVTTPRGPVIVFVLSVLAVLRFEAAGAKVGWGFGVSRPLWVRRAPDDIEAVEEGVMDDKGSRAAEDGGRLFGILTSIDKLTTAIEHAASGERAVGPTTTAGDHVVIPLVETYAQGGFGAGGGSGNEGEASGGSGGGGGGGGVGRSRTIAIADVGPDGVKIRPVIDVTGLALPAVSAIAALLVRSARRRRRR